jgi:nucleotide-binding universal stress UspA family protein
MLPKITTILYATGLGPGAPYIFRHALSLAKQYQAKIIALHCLEPLSTFGQSLVGQYLSEEESEALHTKARESVTARLRERIATLCARECEGQPECSNAVSEICIVEDHPAQAIIEYADRYKADVIVMGSHRLSMVTKVFLGSNTRKVLHNASQPVLVVKVPKGLVEEL